MITTLKKPNQYIFNNDTFRLASKSLYGCFTEDDLCRGELDSSDVIKKPFKTFNTNLNSFHFLDNTSVRSKFKTDYSDALYSLNEASSLVVGDFIYLPHSIQHNILQPRFNVKPYLFSSGWDISLVSDKLMKSIGVPEWFLLKYLLCGVPDNVRYNNLVDAYLLQHKITPAEFRDQLLNRYTLPFRPTVKICRGFISLALINLSGRYTKTKYKINLKLKDFEDSLIKNVVSFLDVHSVRYTFTDSELIIHSYLLCNLFEHDFNSYKFFHTLSPYHKLQVIKAIKEFNSVAGKKISLLYVQDFLKRYGEILSSISEFNSTYSILTLLKESEEYIKTEEGFLVPILSIESNDESVLQLNIREINDN